MNMTLKEIKRRVSANKLNGIDSEWVDPKQIKKLVPIMNTENCRYPVLELLINLELEQHVMMLLHGDMQ